MNDAEFLQWIHDRLVNVHKENELCDYMYRLRKIIATTQAAAEPDEYWLDGPYNGIEEAEAVEPAPQTEPFTLKDYNEWVNKHGYAG